MDKKGLVYLTIGLYGVAGALALEAVPGLSQWMQLVAFPSSEFALAVFGGEMINAFAIALLVGVFIGTYSSIYVAANALLIMGVSKEDLVIPVKEGAEQEDMMP